jgi:PAS domain S-box-containing protein
MNLKSILEEWRERVIDEWVRRLKTNVSERYSQRPFEELMITVSAAYDASTYVLLFNDYSKIDCHIEWITRARLHGGFTLSEVQNAYELLRELLVPIFLENLKGGELKEALLKLNACTFYTITKFSNNFQSLHESKIKEHALNLERMVEKRTRELAESESKYRTLVEDINDGYFVNQDGVIVFANRAYCDMHGYDISEVIGRPYYEFIADESLDFVRALYNERIEKGEAPELYVYLRKHKNGGCFPTENKVKIITLNGRKAVAGICRDMDICDNGPGIDKGVLPFIFDPFFSNKKKGTGLDLFNVKKIIDAHGGKVEVYPGKRKGVRFSILLPFDRLK